MKAYFFAHSYLSSIQKGIQAAHTLTEMSMYLTLNKKYCKQFTTWAEDYKTIIILNGGNSVTLWGIWKSLCDLRNQLKIECLLNFFCEDDATMNKSITCVGIIVADDCPQELRDYINQFQLAV